MPCKWNDGGCEESMSLICEFVDSDGLCKMKEISNNEDCMWITRDTRCSKQMKNVCPYSNNGACTYIDELNWLAKLAYKVYVTSVYKHDKDETLPDWDDLPRSIQYAWKEVGKRISKEFKI